MLQHNAGAALYFAAMCFNAYAHAVFSTACTLCTHWMCSLLPAVTVKANYRLIYALLTAGASTAGASTDSHCGGPRGKDDISSAMSLAVLAAFGVDVRPKDPMYYYSKDLWNSNCAKPAKLLNFSSPDFQTNPEFDAVHDICKFDETVSAGGGTWGGGGPVHRQSMHPHLVGMLPASL